MSNPSKNKGNKLMNFSKEDLAEVKKRNWIDGFLWGSYLSVIITLVVCTLVTIIWR